MGVDAMMTLDGYVARVLDGPQARALDSRAEEGRARVEGAGLWPNPALSYERQSGPWETQTRGSQDFVLAEVPLVFFGRLGAEHDAALARAHGAEHERRGGIARLRLAATAAYLDTVRQLRRAAALHDARALLAPVVDAARKRADAGESASGDALRLEVELARLDDDVAAAESDALAAHAHAQALAGTALPPFSPAPVSLAAVAGDASTTRADIAALEAAADAAGHDESAASLRLIPDVTLGAGPSFLNSGSADFGVGYALSLRVALPLFDRGQGELARARAEKATADAERTALAAQASAQVQAATERARRDRARAQAFANDVVPRAEALFFSTSKAVAIGGGTSDVLALVDAARTLREAHTTLVDLESAAALAQAELLFATGAWDAPKESTR